MTPAARVVQLGLGPIGASVVRVLARRRDLELVGAVDIDPSKVGRDVGDVAGIAPMGVIVSDDLARTLQAVAPDVVIHCTASRLQDIRRDLEAALDAGVRIVSSSEELVYPAELHRELSSELDSYARSRGSALLGTGINPGFAMDTFPLAVTAVCERVDRISVTRVQEAGTRRLPLQLKVGAGKSRAEFDAGVAAGTVGHMGLPQSATMIADALGWSIDGLQETIEPVISDIAMKTEHVEVAPGQVSGVHQLLIAQHQGVPIVTLDLWMHVGVANPRDEVVVDGVPPVHVVAPGGFLGDPATAAILVNSIRPLLSVAPGFHSMLDLPISRSVGNT